MEEGIEPGGRRQWRATIANGGVGGGGKDLEMVVLAVEAVADDGIGGGGRQKQTVVFVEEEWQRRQMSLAVVDDTCILGFQNDFEFVRKKKGTNTSQYSTSGFTFSSGLTDQPAPPRRKPARAAGYAGQA